MSDFVRHILQLILHLKSKSGRREIGLRLQHRTWPFSGWLAYVYRRTFICSVKIVVVIGSLGKTTTTKAILTAVGRKYPEKVVSNQYGTLCLSLLRISPFSNFEVFEVALGKPGDIKKIAPIILPDVVVFTSVGNDHATNFSGLKHIAEEKAQMLQYLREQGTIFVNGDDSLVMQHVSQFSKEVISYGFGKNNQIRCLNYSINYRKGIECEVKWNEEKIFCKTKLFGDKLIYSLLTAIGVARKLDFTMNEILNNLQKLTPAYGRMQVDILPNGATVIGNFFKASTDGIYAAFNQLKGFKKLRLFVVFGNIAYINNPEFAEEKAGEEIAGFATKAFFIGNYEEALTRGAVKGGMKTENIVKAGNRWETVFTKLNPNLEEGDFVFISTRLAQKMERLLIALKGEVVNCKKQHCNFYCYCKNCSLL